MTELKPCPFCGGTAERHATDGYGVEWYVMCKDCGCSTMARYRGKDIEAWNRRVNE